MTAGHSGAASTPISAAAFQVEAQGFETATVPVSLTAGTTTDLGIVSLSPARGTVTVQVRGLDAGARYRVGCIAPGDATGAVPTILPDDGEYVFEGLVCRAYTIFVVAFDGGPVVTETVKLASESAHQIVTMDAAKLGATRAATFK